MISPDMNSGTRTGYINISVRNSLRVTHIDIHLRKTGESNNRNDVITTRNKRTVVLI